MNMQGLNKRLLNVESIQANTLLLILFSILLIFMGALTSIVLFTYQNTLKIAEDSQQQILINKDLNRVIINNTREIPLQNRAMLEDLTKIVNFLGANFNQTFIDGIYEDRARTNETLTRILQSQKLLEEHINATTDYLGTASHITTPGLRNALYASATSNSVTKDSFTIQLEELLTDLNQSSSIIQNLQQQVKNLSQQVPNASSTVEEEFGMSFPFAENRVERADIPANESLTKEPEGGRIAGLSKP